MHDRRGEISVRFNALKMERRSFVLCLLLIWVICLTVGGLVAALARPFVRSSVQASLNANISVFSLLNYLIPIVLPFLLIHFRISPAYCVVPLCCVKAFTFGFCLILCLLSNPFSGWLITFLLLFSSIASSPSILFFWSICFNSSRQSILLPTIINGAICFFIWLLDYTYIVTLIPTT